MATRRSTRSERLKHVRAWHASGKSARVYAARAKINVNTLQHWSWQLRQEGEEVDGAPARGFDFVELSDPAAIAAAGTPIEIDTGRVTLRVSDGFEAATLRRILDALEGKS